MLEYAISRNQRQLPTRRIYASWIASFICHAIMLVMLIEYPQLLQGGMYHRFRALSSVPDADASKDDRNWRTVAVLRNPSPMNAPSAATLRKYAYDWNKKEPAAPPVRIRWGDQQKAALIEEAASVPRPKPQPPGPEAIAAQAAPPAPVDSASGSPPGAVQVEPNANSGLYLPPPSTEVKSRPEMAGNAVPGSIPGARPVSVSSSAASNPKIPESAAKIFENEQQALRSPEGGFFDTKGFPLGDYANLIIERIKGKWFIPSNLRNSQGNTTIVFFINKEGRFTDARIVMPSGNDSLDLAALNAVMASNPFPPLPKGFPGDRVGAKFVFSYNEP